MVPKAMAEIELKKIGRKSSFHSAMAETSGSGVPSTKTLSHRGAVLPFLLAGSRWELVSATTVCINSTFDLNKQIPRRFKSVRSEAAGFIFF